MNRLSYAVALLSVMLISPVGAAPASLMNIEEFCDLNDDAPISDVCYGFVGAVMEIVQLEHDMQVFQRVPFSNACIPFATPVEQAIIKIRPKLRQRECNGKCYATLYVRAALAQIYPCNK